MPKEPKCEVCGAVIIAVLSDVGSANGYLCLDCSGTTLEDFDEFERVDEMRTFHGKSQYD